MIATEVCWSAMTKLSDVRGPNYDAVEAEVIIKQDGEEVARVYPQKRRYRVQTNPMTEAGIDSDWMVERWLEPFENSPLASRVAYALAWRNASAMSPAMSAKHVP